MKQKTINILLIFIIFIIIVIPTIWYVNKVHNDDLWLVVNKEVIEAANKCKNENVCKENKVRTCIKTSYYNQIDCIRNYVSIGIR